MQMRVKGKRLLKKKKFLLSFELGNETGLEKDTSGTGEKTNVMKISGDADQGEQ